MLKRAYKNVVVLLAVFLMLFSQAAFAETSAAGSSGPDSEYYQKIIDMIKDKYRGNINGDNLTQGTLKGIFGSLDPYTTFFTPAEANSFFDEMSGTYSGIGAQLELDGNYVMISKVFSGSPAEKAGIMPRDRIAAVDGNNMTGASIEEVRSKVIGEAGTKVTLGILREGLKGVTDIEITRGEVAINPVTYRIKGDIGYIKLDMFNANTSEGFDQALGAMDKAGIVKIILDLRNNPGGLVDQAVAVARRLVPAGLITKLDFKSEAFQDEEYYSYLEKPRYKLAVLVNENSASASEILAGAIQDTKAGKLIGMKTFGKAKVQVTIPILSPEAYEKYKEKYNVDTVDVYGLNQKYGIYPSDEDIIGQTKMTVGVYTTPKGRMIDLRGIGPDIRIADYKPVKGIDVNSVQELTATVKPKLGSEALDVYNAEKILALAGYDVDAPDTKLDGKTFKAIEAFQKNAGLYPYGVLDFATQYALNKKLDELVTQIDKQYAKAVEQLSK